MQRLGEDDLDGLAVLAHGATTTNASHDNVVATTAATAGLAVVKVVVLTLLAGVHAVLALEDTGAHVGGALGALGVDIVTVHVDVTGDIEGTVLAEGDLPPGVVDTTELGECGAGVEGCAGGGHLLLEGELNRLASGNLDQDVRVVDVKAHAVEALRLPAREHHVLVGAVVGELGLPLAVAADPDTIPGGLLVETGLALDLLGPFRDTVKEITDSVGDVVANVTDGVTKVAEQVVGLSGGGSRLSSGGGRGLLLGGVRGGLGGSLYIGDRSDLRGGSGSGCRSGEDGAPVDITKVVCDLAPVNVVASTALGITSQD